MKKLLIFISLLSTYQFYCQSVSINTTTYSTEQLVNQVLINSPCVFGTNIQFRTGTSFGSSNGIGYFENSNPNFPFARGVVLSTGDVNRIPGPNNTILSDGTTSWAGDTSLESVLLSQSGVSINSINASFIQFDFQPKTSNFNFSFLFASEEYGTSQCNFSDAFAFLLEDITAGGAAQNLAVIPNTSIPVSVETIRDMTYNSNCSSENASYFGAFNGSGFGTAINLNGQTVPMLASANGLDINHVYRIKIVIADGGANTAYDSAIFLQANSFNIGQDVLGLDYTVANNRAFCPGSTLPILSAAGLAAGTTFSWSKEGIAISPAQTGETLDLNNLNPLIGPGIHRYTVTYQEPGCVAVTDDILVEIYPQIGILSVLPNLYRCDTAASNYIFDLTQMSTILLAGINQQSSAAGALDDLPASTIISYHSSQTEAEANTGGLTTSQTISTSQNGITLYVRVQNPTTLCFEVRSFQLQIVDPPQIATQPSTMTLCARNSTETPLRANFNLSTAIAEIIGTQNTTYNRISFHSSSVGANNNANRITIGPGNQLLSASTTIWVRLQNISENNCFVTTSFQLVVDPLPSIDILPDVFVCTSYTLPNLNSLGAQYWTGPNGTGTQLFPGNTITTTTRNLYVYNQSALCTNQDSFNVTIADLDDITPPSGTYCTQYRLPAIPYASYYTQSGGPTTAGNVNLPGGTIINNGGNNTIFVWFEDTISTPTCTLERQFTITIIPFTPLPTYTNQFACSSYTIPTDANGATYYTGSNKTGLVVLPGSIITSSIRIYAYKESLTLPVNCVSEVPFDVFIGLPSITPPADVDSCSSYPLPALTVGEYRTAAAGNGSLIAAGTLINTTTTLWFYVPGQNCTDNLNFTITVNIEPLPNFPDTAPQCDVYFLPAVPHAGNYFTGTQGTGRRLAVGTPITASQRIYFYDRAPSGSCFVEEDFFVTINRSPPIDAKPTEVIRCGQPYILDDLRNGEYYAFSGGPSSTNPVLPAGTVIDSSRTIYVYASASSPNTCVSEYSIAILVTFVNEIDDQYACNSYNLPPIVGMGSYYTAPNGPNGTGVLLTPPYNPVTTTSTFYVFVENNNRVNCTDEDAFTVTIYNTPAIVPISPVTRCESYALPAYPAQVTRYFRNSGGPSTTNTEFFPGDVITSSTTIYAYAESGTSATVLCPAEQPFAITITESPQPNLTVPSICIDTANGTTTNAVIESGFSAPQYGFEWRDETGSLVGTSSSFSTNRPGNYTLNVFNLAIFECSSGPVPFEIVTSALPKAITYTTSGWFTENQTITIITSLLVGSESVFSYSLDGGPYQDSPVFTNVPSGRYEVTILENNCGLVTAPIFIRLISSPKFFTPNNDGYNDTWNISGIPREGTLNLYIFDRYGKLLKTLDPNGNGWDGTYNGNPMPADDYWFTISYIEDNVQKEYKSHFSLKR
jgi:gliding motility-associated-like protein